jgi:hypothetical protein
MPCRLLSNADPNQLSRNSSNDRSTVNGPSTVTDSSVANSRRSSLHYPNHLTAAQLESLVHLDGQFAWACTSSLALVRGWFTTIVGRQSTFTMQHRKCVLGRIHVACLITRKQRLLPWLAACSICRLTSTPTLHFTDRRVHARRLQSLRLLCIICGGAATSRTLCTCDCQTSSQVRKEFNRHV